MVPTFLIRLESCFRRWGLFLRFALKVFIGKLNVFNEFLMILYGSVGIDNKKLIISRIVILMVHLASDKCELKLPFVFDIDFDDTSDASHKDPRCFEMKSIIIAKQFYLIVIFAVLIKSFQILLALRVLNIILKLYPCAAVVAFHQLADLFRVRFIIFGQRY